MSRLVRFWLFTTDPVDRRTYWRLFSDYLIHRIHVRVLEHIKREVEGDVGRSAS